MTNQPYNQTKQELGPLPVMGERLWRVDTAVDRLSDSYVGSRVIKGMENVSIGETIYRGFLRQVGSTTLPESVRKSKLPVIKPVRFARRLVSKALAIMPSAVPNQNVNIEPMPVPEPAVAVETTLQPQPTIEAQQPAQVAVPVVTADLESVNVPEVGLNMVAIRAQINSLFEGNHAGLN